MAIQKVTYVVLKQAILESLTPDLLSPQYRKQLMPGQPPETGHCAVATEAFYYLAGGKAAGFMPVVCGYGVDDAGRMHFDAAPNLRRETHWWLRAPKGTVRGAGAVVDVTAAQFEGAFPYARGHNTGFMQPQKKPSRRAQVVMDRVTEKLGAAALETFRRENLRRFTAPQKVTILRR